MRMSHHPMHAACPISLICSNHEARHYVTFLYPPIIFPGLVPNIYLPALSSYTLISQWMAVWGPHPILQRRLDMQRTESKSVTQKQRNLYNFDNILRK